MVSPKILKFFFIFLLVFPIMFKKSQTYDPSSLSLEEKKRGMSEMILDQFHYGYHNYRKYAFPHDELKPISGTATDSLSGFGNRKHLAEFRGSGITLVESMSSLLIMGYHDYFKDGIVKLTENLNFDVDARINLYEWNTRVLGGLVSAHILATDLLQESYNNELLDLAEGLGRRFLPAFDTPTGLPYAWINLKYGVLKNETTETTTAECGSLILEMGVLSRLTCDTRFESAALRALRKLWSMRSPLDLLGTKLDVVSGKWIDHSSGIGAGIDSFYEYLVKGHVLFGREEFWTMFQSAYIAVQRYIRYDNASSIRYKTVDMRTGEEINNHLTSLQAFWPGLQVLIGDIASANSTHHDFYSAWMQYGGLPERYLWKDNEMEIIEGRYPLRPEFAESTFYLYQATKDEWYCMVGEIILNTLIWKSLSFYGFGSVKDVRDRGQEDHQPGYFLSETCKYLFLIYNDSFLDTGNYIFTTKGHPLPVMSPGGHYWLHTPRPRHNFSNNDDWASLIQKLGETKQPSALSKRICPSFNTTTTDYMPGTESACHVQDSRTDHTCSTDEECGVELLSCVPRQCSSDGYCSDGYFHSHFLSLHLWRKARDNAITYLREHNITGVIDEEDIFGFLILNRWPRTEEKLENSWPLSEFDDVERWIYMI